MGAPDDCIRCGMSVAEGRSVRFRHELARSAVEDDVPAARAAWLHGRILAHLVGTDAVDAARLSYHADAAGHAAAVLRYAPVAAEQTSGAGAHREAAAHYGRSLRHAGGASTARLAELWERRADACERTRPDRTGPQRDGRRRRCRDTGDRDVAGGG